MINGKRVAVVMPAYNAEKTLEKTVRELSDLVDIRILVDDSSKEERSRGDRLPLGSGAWNVRDLLGLRSAYNRAV